MLWPLFLRIKHHVVSSAAAGSASDGLHRSRRYGYASASGAPSITKAMARFQFSATKLMPSGRPIWTLHSNLRAASLSTREIQSYPIEII